MTVTAVARDGLFVTVTRDGETVKRQLVYSDLVSSVITTGNFKVLQAYRDSNGDLVITYEDANGDEQLMTLSSVASHEAESDPHTVYQKESEKSQTNGYASLDIGTKVPTAELGGAGADNTKYLRGDQSWQTIAGGGGMLKYTYDSDADGVIAKAQLDAALANTSGTNTGDQTLAGLGGVAHSLATAVNDFLVASGVGTFV